MRSLLDSGVTSSWRRVVDGRPPTEIAILDAACFVTPRVDCRSIAGL